MTTTRRPRVACLLGVALLLAGCSGPAPAGSTPNATAAAPDATTPDAATPDAATDPAPATGTAEDAARAACAELDAMPLGGTEVGPLQQQQHGLTAAAEHLLVAADADAGYLDDAEVVEAMAAGAADAIALLEEHGENPDSWDAAVQRAWGTYALNQADGLMLVFQLCNTVDPPGGSSEG